MYPLNLLEQRRNRWVKSRITTLNQLQITASLLQTLNLASSPPINLPIFPAVHLVQHPIAKLDLLVVASLVQPKAIANLLSHFLIIKILFHPEVSRYFCHLKNHFLDNSLYHRDVTSNFLVFWYQLLQCPYLQSGIPRKMQTVVSLSLFFLLHNHSSLKDYAVNYLFSFSNLQKMKNLNRAAHLSERPKRRVLLWSMKSNANFMSR